MAHNLFPREFYFLIPVLISPVALPDLEFWETTTASSNMLLSA